MNQGQPSPAQECHLCGQRGVVLASDVFSPETHMWFCTEDWPEYEAIMSIVEDRRMETAQQHLSLFFQAIPDIAAMVVVEAIFHHQAESDFCAEENDDAESDYHAREAEHLEDILEEADYSYVGINNIIYLYKGDDIIADLDLDMYSWKRTDENVDPIAAIYNVVEDRREKDGEM